MQTRTNSLRVFYLLAGLAFVAALLRLGVYEHYIVPLAAASPFSPFAFPDSVNFYEYARSLAERGEYVDAAGRLAWRTPGYSLILAGLLKLGITSQLALHLPNILLGALNTVLAALLARRVFFSWRAAFLAAAGVCLYPFYVFMDGLVLSDTLTVTGVLLLSLAGVQFVNAQSRWQLLRASILIGLCAAVCVYAKPSAGLLLAPVIVFLMVAQRYAGVRHGGIGMRWACVMAVTFAAAMYPWVHRNEVRLGEFVPFSTMSGFTLWESVRPESTGGVSRPEWKMPQPWLDMQQRQGAPGGKLADNPDMVLTYPVPNAKEGMRYYGSTSAEVAADSYLQALSIVEMKREPWRMVELATRKFLRTWSPIPNWVGADRWDYKLAMLLSFGPVLMLAILGISLCRANWRLAYLLYLPAAYFAVVHMVFQGSVRYRIPAEACLIVVAAGVLDYLLTRLFPAKAAPLAPSAAPQAPQS